MVVPTAKKQAKNDPRPSRTRKALIDAGQRLMVSQPIEGLTIDDIAVAAGVARGSFYNHFSDREAFAAAIAVQIRAHIAELITRSIQGPSDPALRIAKALFAVVEYAIRHPDNARLVLAMNLVKTDPAALGNAKVGADLKRGTDTGVFNFSHPGIGVAIFVGTISMAMRTVLDERIDGADFWKELGARLLISLGVDAPQAFEISEEAFGVMGLHELLNDQQLLRSRAACPPATKHDRA